MAEIILLYSPPVLKGGIPAYYVRLTSGGNTGEPFATARDALEQFKLYKKQGHTFTADQDSQQELLELFKDHASQGR